jgi:LacI family transcriptional regulator
MRKPPISGSTPASAPRAPLAIRATLREVAREAGVSVMTVSNVINRKFNLMSESTKQNVNDAIEKTNYRPHSRARSLRLAQDFSIGLIIVDPSPTFLADPFTTHVVAGLSNYTSERGYALQIQGIGNGELAETPLLKRHQTDALCVMVSGDPLTRDRLYRALQSAHQPLVVFQERVPNFLTDAISVRQDDRGGGAMLAKRLLARGARELVYLKEAHPWPALESRERGIDRVVREMGGRLLSVTCETAGFADAQFAFAAHVNKRGLPDAVLAGNDQIAIAVLKWLAEHSIKVPQQIMVTGFNAFEFGLFATPSLTTIRSPAYKLGEIAAAHLIDRLSSSKFKQRNVMLAVSLQDGDSG